MYLKSQFLNSPSTNMTNISGRFSQNYLVFTTVPDICYHLSSSKDLENPGYGI